MYRVTEGNNASYTPGQDLVFRCDGELDNLEGIYVDGERVDPSNYTLKRGSTILTLKAGFLDTLGSGEHTLEFRYTDGGSANVTFTVEAKVTPEMPQESAKPATPTPTPKTDVPKTGDSTNPVALGVIAVLALGAGVTVLVVRKRKINQ